jgi:hypothetical protein
MTMLIQFRLDEVALGPLSLFKKLRECGVEKFELLPTGPQPTLPGSEDTGSWLFTANAKRKLVGNTARMPSPTKTAAKATKHDTRTGRTNTAGQWSHAAATGPCSRQECACRAGNASWPKRDLAEKRSKHARKGESRQTGHQQRPRRLCVDHKGKPNDRQNRHQPVTRS